VQKKAVKRLALVIAGGFVLTGVVLAMLAFLESGYLGDSSAASFGWIIPVVAGTVIGVVAFLLLDSDRSATEADVGLKSTTCSACGAEIIEDWRMCPDCGEVLDEERAVRQDYRSRAIL
jgi:predicted RNA-binding Zn-ribbon protein involved in translation (DUF1610 family)